MVFNPRLPSNVNTNNLQTNKFTFSLPSMAISSFMCQTVMIPGVSTSAVLVPTPFSETFRHGDKMMYDQLVITFMVDEDMKNWQEAYDWVRGLTFPHDMTEYDARVRKGLYHDGILTINKNSNLPNLRFKFTNCHPTALGPITMSTADDANAIPVCDLTIQFDLLEIDRLDHSIT